MTSSASPGSPFSSRSEAIPGAGRVYHQLQSLSTSVKILKPGPEFNLGPVPIASSSPPGFLEASDALSLEGARGRDCCGRAAQRASLYLHKNSNIGALVANSQRASPALNLHILCTTPAVLSGLLAHALSPLLLSKPLKLQLVSSAFLDWTAHACS